MDSATPPPLPPRPSLFARIAFAVLKGIALLALFLLILLHVGLIMPSLDLHREGDRQVAIANMKQLHPYLEQFRTDYGSYPCDATAELLKEQYPEYDFGELRGGHANAYLRQLFYLNEEHLREKFFYAKLDGEAWGLPAMRVGDNRLHQKALEAGENAFAYVLRVGEGGARLGVSPSGEPTPLLLCPLYPTESPQAGDKLRFERHSFHGHAYVLSTDGSVRDRKDGLEKDTELRRALRPAAGQALFPARPDGSGSAAQHIVLPPLR